MSFRKPFQAVPIRLGDYHLTKERRENRSRNARSAIAGVLLATAVFIIGMIATNFTTLADHWNRWTATTDFLPTFNRVYYPNCNAARAAGKAPLWFGEAGYRPELDYDRDGVACEPYVGMDFPSRGRW